MYHIMHAYPIFFFRLQKTLMSIPRSFTTCGELDVVVFSQNLSEGHLFSFPSLVFVVT